MEITLDKKVGDKTTLNDLTKVYFMACLTAIESGTDKEEKKALDNICNLINELEDFNIVVQAVIDENDRTFKA